MVRASFAYNKALISIKSRIIKGKAQKQVTYVVTTIRTVSASTAAVSGPF